MRRERKFCQSATFDAHCCLEVDRESLHRHIEDLLRCRQQTACVLANHRRTHSDHLRYLWVADVATGDLVTLGIPRLSACRLIILVIHNPLLSSGNELLFVFNHCVDQTRCQRLFRSNALAFNNIFIGRHQPHEIHRFDVAATSWKQAQCHLGEAELDAAVVPRDAVVA